MAEHKGRYYQLPYLDVIDQPAVINSGANKAKTLLRAAVNENRQDDMAMRELIVILKHTLEHISKAEDQVRKPRKARAKSLKIG